jgi:hypothetical protein
MSSQKKPRNKPVIPSMEQKIMIVEQLFIHRQCLFKEQKDQTSLSVVLAKEEVLKFCHSIGLMYVDYGKLKKAYRDWRVPMEKDIKESRKTGSGGKKPLTELAQLMIQVEEGNGRFDVSMQVIKCLKK